jgi:adenosylmethionine-8-amino-7-oxononanoate aminotransferase
VTQKLIDGMLDRGLYSRAVLDCVCIAPPLITSDADIDRIVSIVGETVEAVAAAVA